jgi:hypothetical protein
MRVSAAAAGRLTRRTRVVGPGMRGEEPFYRKDHPGAERNVVRKVTSVTAVASVMAVI